MGLNPTAESDFVRLRPFLAITKMLAGARAHTCRILQLIFHAKRRSGKAPCSRNSFAYEAQKPRERRRGYTGKHPSVRPRDTNRIAQGRGAQHPRRGADGATGDSGAGWLSTDRGVQP